MKATLFQSKKQNTDFKNIYGIPKVFEIIGKKTNGKKRGRF